MTGELPQIKVERVEIASCSLPLERPVTLGTVNVTTRDYICLRVVTDTGIEGFAIGYKSGSLLFDSLARLAPQMIGHNVMMRQAFNLAAESSSVPARAFYVRALSLIDVAFWDIAAKAARIPLHAMLGGLRTEVAAMPVLGFSYTSRSTDEIRSEIDRHRASGETLIKVMIKGDDALANSRYLSALVKELDDETRLAVDMHWSFRTIAEAYETCRRIDDLGLAFVEDPFLPQQADLIGELRARLKTPVAVGEDVLDPYGFATLMPNVDILRIDATASGGITAAMNALSLASAFGRSAIPHVFPYLHLQLACANRAVRAVEYIPEHTGTDPVRKLLRGFPTIVNGKFQVSGRPGVGCDLDWQVVGDNAEASRSFS